MNINHLSSSDKLAIYYPAISCVQKAVRRCRYEYAKLPALVAWHLNPSRFKMRTYTILHEDCSRDYQLIKFFHENIDESWKTEEGMLQIIKHLCDGYKSREAANLLSALDRKYDFYLTMEKIRSHLGDLLNLRSLYPKISYEKLLCEFDSLGYSIPDWLGQHLIRCFDQKWERENLGFFIPYLFNIDKGCSYRTYNTSENVLIDETYNGLLLLDGLDSHTRTGKKFWSICKKKGWLDPIISALPERFNNYLGATELQWYLFSANLRNVIVYDNDFPDFESDFRNEILTAPVTEAYRKASPQLESLKRWLIGKDCKEFIDACLSVENK